MSFSNITQRATRLDECAADGCVVPGYRETDCGGRLQLINIPWLLALSVPIGNAATEAIAKNTVVFCEGEMGGQHDRRRRIALWFWGASCLTTKSSAMVHIGVTRSTEGNQILVRIIPGVAAKFFVVDLKIGHCAARLASPTVAA